jgi:hypothetical protein
VQKKAVANTKPEPALVFGQQATYEPWSNGIPVSYFFTELDKALDISKQKEFFAKFPAGSFSYSLNSSHTPFLSMPHKLADGLVEAVASLGAASDCPV